MMKPLLVALKGKGTAKLLKRVGTISKRYGFNTAKMDRALNRLAQLLHEYNCRATLPITSVTLARNGAIIQKYQAQGIEFAIHGYRHVDHSLLTLKEQCEQFQKAQEIFHNEGIKFQGFRSPYLRWNEDTLTALGQNGFIYDSSNSLVWQIDKKHETTSYRRALEFYGAEPAGDYPALPALNGQGDLVRIPYSLPDDESLIERLVWTSAPERDEVWPGMFRQIHTRGELFTLGLHPERTAECTTGLAATMREVRAAGADVWPATLSEIAVWWKARYATQVKLERLHDALWQLSVAGPDGTTLLLRSLETKTATEPWFQGYVIAREQPCIVQATKKPFIGLSPEVHPALKNFLKQQGYIVETATEPDTYSYYIDRSSFSRADERPLLDAIEAADFPLVRLGRWPHGARSAFNVTGDIDALTFWDYSQRLWEK